MEFKGLPEIDDFRSIILNETPLLDVRAPIEFIKGALPLAENHPLINDEERHEIGTQYADKGQNAAIKLGYDLVQGETKKSRIKAWEDFVRRHPDGVLYCWRGGMRSKLTQQALYDESGIIYPRIKGGYKALRTFLLDELEASANAMEIAVIGGRTGSGKTIFLNNLENSIDLEGLAKHRGSAFGPRAESQPSQVNFENELSIELIKHRAKGHNLIVIEDEGRNIGSRGVPECLHKKMVKSPLLLLEVPLEERVDITFQEYITDALDEYLTLFGDDEGYQKWREYLLNSIDKIKKRLGGEQHSVLRSMIQQAIGEYVSNNDGTIFKEIIQELLFGYYDPMYDYQIGKKKELVTLRGDSETLINYLKERSQR